GVPQLAADGPILVGAAPVLTEDELAPVAREAVARWAATGLSAAQLERLNAVQYQIGTLGGSYLGLTELGSTVVRLDATAAGYGWFIDSTPADDAEFGAGAGPRELWAAPGSPAFGRMDLLTVVAHELGHVLGLDDLDPQAVPHDLLTTTLSTGVRRLPDPSFGSPDPVAAQPARAPAALDLSAPPALPVVSTTDAVESAPQQTVAGPAILKMDASLLIGSGLLGNNGVLSGAVQWTQLTENSSPPPSSEQFAALDSALGGAATSGNAAGATG